jgi:nicotinate phosphoribosyltransferase
LATIRENTRQQLSMFHAGVKRFVNPHQYPVGLEQGLHERKLKLVLQSRGFNNSERIPKM